MRRPDLKHLALAATYSVAVVVLILDVFFWRAL